MKYATQTGCWLLAVLGAVAGCSAHEPSAANAADEADASARVAPADESPEARAFVQAVQARFVRGWEARPGAGPAAVLRDGDVESLRREGDRIIPVARRPRQSELAHAASIALPAKATASFHIEDDTSRLALDVAPVGAHDVPAKLAAGLVVYEGALDEGATIVHRASWEGTEDWIHFPRRPARAAVAYDVALGERVAGLRLVARTLEFVDASGTPRLRVAAPSLVDGAGHDAEATLTVAGCAVDEDPRAPWGRPPVDPGARVCRVEVGFAADLVYPVMLDPAWTATGNMTSVRSNHSATLLANGKVLVAGGVAVPGSPPTYTSMTELFDPATSTFAATGRMTNVRGAHDASLLATGNVVVSGGLTGATGKSATAATEYYDPSTGKWYSAGALSSARARHTSTTLSDGTVLVVGGADSSGSVLATSDLYTPSTNSWARGNSLVVARAVHTATAFSARSFVLIVGGSDGTNALDAVEYYDVASGKFSRLSSMAEMRYGHTANLMPDGTIVVTGGDDGYHFGVSSVETYDTKADTWTRTAKMWSGRYWHTASLLGGNLVIVDGTYGYSNGSGGVWTSSTSAVEVYTPGSTDDSFLGLVSTANRSGHAATVLGPGTLLVTGGDGLNSAETYRGLGLPCKYSSDCSTGFCVDGYCCETACGGGVATDCMNCGLAGQLGTCTAEYAGTQCRGFAGVCDVSETCDGRSPTCPTDTFQPSTTSCRTAANECDVAEFCTGSAASCPSDVGKGATTSCTDDGNVCTVDVCGTVGGAPACTHAAGNAGTTCRAAGNECDLAEVCTGTSTVCPTNVVKTAGTACTDDGNVCTTDKCNGTITSPSCVHAAGNQGTQCRASAGACDAAEVCDGASTSCPTDVKQPSSYVCRAKVDLCDVDDKCDGVSNNCPADALAGNAVQCRAASCTAAVATIAAYCTGSSSACPTVTTQSCAPSTCSGTQCGGCSTDAQCGSTQYCSGGVCTAKKGSGSACAAGNECTSTFCADGVCCDTACTAGVCDSCVNSGNVGKCTAVPAATVCRPAAGECDVAETCGGATSCPADGKKAQNSSCGDDGNVCTQDVCDGSSTACTHPAGNAGTLCRAANGSACDVADYCSGTSSTCADAKATASTVCRGAAGECDLAENCDGASDACPSDAKRANGATCTDDGNVCTSDVCNGASAACTHPAGNSGTVCRAAAGVCDVDDKCDGVSTGCADAKATSSTVCRVAVGECDLDDKCDGVGNACPSDVKKPAGTSCSTDNNPCTVDACDGTQTSCQHAAGFAGTVCRAAAGPCDNAESCDGTSTACPTDTKKTVGTVCRAAADVCDVAEQCDGTSVSCPTDGFQAATYSCRSASCASAVATLAATCTGSSASCPTATTQSCAPSTCSGTQCGGCTSDAQCAGTQYCSAGVCVAKKSNGKTCGGANECTSTFCADGVCCDTACNAGVCDSCVAATAGTCSPVDPATVCRPATGECDVAETCGGAMACPADATRDGQSCSNDGNVCTSDVCQGTTCAHPAAPAATVCRAATGECDVAETCGGATSCPADGFVADQTGCTTDNNVCTVDVCVGGACTHPAGNQGTECRAVASECDVAEACDGTSTACPKDGFVADSTPCSGDGNVCTLDVCVIGICAHPPGNAGTECRAAVGECDVAETCSGSSAACPSDGFKSNGSTCSDDGLPCTVDQCQTGLCAHAAGNRGSVCRSATGECDVAEACDGTSSACPADVLKADKSTCTDDGNACTLDECIAGACTHPANDGASCSDGNVCTGPDLCAAGQCAGKQIDGCTCKVDADCDDHNACTGTETCDKVAGTCKPGTAPDCDDKNACTTDGCQAASGCTHVALADDTSCDDGKYCSQGSTCKSGACVAKSQRDCSGVATDDCHVGVCDEVSRGCVAQPSTGVSCDDGDACTVSDSCTAGVCAGDAIVGCKACASALDCDDDNPCTKDLCNDLTKQCQHTQYAGCSFDAGVDSGSDAGASDDAGDAGSAEAGGDAAADARADAASDAAAADADAAAIDAGEDVATGTDSGTPDTDAGPTFEKPEVGSFSCRTSGAGRSSAGAGLAVVFALAAVVAARRRRRAAA